MRDSLETGKRRLRRLPLPADTSIARVARAHVTGLLPAFGLSIGDVDDITLMVSELATNVLQHATSRDGAPGAELWVYQRDNGHGQDELVVKTFDTLRGWRPPADPGDDILDHGRGLEIIELLTRGRWGHHPTRSRLRTPPSAARRPGSPSRSRTPCAAAMSGGWTARTPRGTSTR